MRVKVLDQKGALTLLSCLFLAFTSFWAVVCLKREADHFVAMKKEFRFFLCAKNQNGQLKAHIQRMEKLNLAIDLANGALLAGAALPAALPSAKAIKKGAQLLQLRSHFSYLKNLASLTLQKCVFDAQAYKTPYKSVGVIKLKRDWRGRAALRRTKWSQRSTGILLGVPKLLKTKVQVKGPGAALKSRLYSIPEVLRR